MPKIMKTTLIVALILATSTTSAGAQKSGSRDSVPKILSPMGTLLQVHGVYRPGELEGRAIILYRNPADRNITYMTIPSENAGTDAQKKGEQRLEVTVDDDGILKSVLLREGKGWISLPPLEVSPTQEAKLVEALPEFETVPARPPCKGAYQSSEWLTAFGMRCLFDFYSCSKNAGPIGGAACCVGGFGAVPACPRLNVSTAAKAAGQ